LVGDFPALPRSRGGAKLALELILSNLHGALHKNYSDQALRVAIGVVHRFRQRAEEIGKDRSRTGWHTCC
jgi:hypothetical protein